MRNRLNSYVALWFDNLNPGVQARWCTAFIKVNRNGDRAQSHEADKSQTKYPDPHLQILLRRRRVVNEQPLQGAVSTRRSIL